MKTNSEKARLQVRIKQLEWELVVANASRTSSYSFASTDLNKLKRDNMMGSGVILQAHHLGGKQAMMPVNIRDGLPDPLVKELKEVLQESYDLSKLFVVNHD